MPRKVDITLRTTATPKQVWEAWTDPTRLKEWLLDHATGEPQPGTAYTWSWDSSDPGMSIAVHEADREGKLALGFPGPGSLLEITIHKDGGDTVIHLVNSGFRDGVAWEDEFAGFLNGWTFCLEILKLYLEHHWQQPRQMLAVLETVRFDYAQLTEPYRNPATWLDLGVPLPTHVLADAKREVCYRWDEIQGILELKSFESPGGRTLGIRAISWSEHPVFDAMKLLAESSIARLIQSLDGTARP